MYGVAGRHNTLQFRFSPTDDFVHTVSELLCHCSSTWHYKFPINKFHECLNGDVNEATFEAKATGLKAEARGIKWHMLVTAIFFFVKEVNFYERKCLTVSDIESNHV